MLSCLSVQVNFAESAQLSPVEKIAAVMHLKPFERAYALCTVPFFSHELHPLDSICLTRFEDGDPFASLRRKAASCNSNTNTVWEVDLNDQEISHSHAYLLLYQNRLMYGNDGAAWNAPKSFARPSVGESRGEADDEVERSSHAAQAVNDDATSAVITCGGSHFPSRLLSSTPSTSLLPPTTSLPYGEHLSTSTSFSSILSTTSYSLSESPWADFSSSSSTSTSTSAPSPVPWSSQSRVMSGHRSAVPSVPSLPSSLSPTTVPLSPAENAFLHGQENFLKSSLKESREEDGSVDSYSGRDHGNSRFGRRSNSGCSGGSVDTPGMSEAERRALGTQGDVTVLYAPVVMQPGFYAVRLRLVDLNEDERESLLSLPAVPPSSLSSSDGSSAGYFVPSASDSLATFLKNGSNSTSKVGFYYNRCVPMWVGI